MVKDIDRWYTKLVPLFSPKKFLVESWNVSWKPHLRSFLRFIMMCVVFFCVWMLWLFHALYVLCLMKTQCCFIVVLANIGIVMNSLKTQWHHIFYESWFVHVCFCFMLMWFWQETPESEHLPNMFLRCFVIQSKLSTVVGLQLTLSGYTTLKCILDSYGI